MSDATSAPPADLDEKSLSGLLDYIDWTRVARAGIKLSGGGGGDSDEGRSQLYSLPMDWQRDYGVQGGIGTGPIATRAEADLRAAGIELARQSACYADVIPTDFLHKLACDRKPAVFDVQMPYQGGNARSRVEVRFTPTVDLNIKDLSKSGIGFKLDIRF